MGAWVLCYFSLWCKTFCYGHFWWYFFFFWFEKLMISCISLLYTFVYVHQIWKYWSSVSLGPLCPWSMPCWSWGMMVSCEPCNFSGFLAFERNWGLTTKMIAWLLDHIDMSFSCYTPHWWLVDGVGGICHHGRYYINKGCDYHHDLILIGFCWMDY